MPFWKRAGGDDAGLKHPASAEHALGTLPCSMPGCEAETGLPCAYVDRRGRECGTAWCPEHRLLAAGQVHCRRHHGVVSGLDDGGGLLDPTLPDRDNRAPSLVAWVARRLDHGVEEILRGHAADHAMRVVNLPVHLVFLGRERVRTWERTWALADHTGHRLPVSLQVEEEKDTEVVLRVGRNVVTRLVPPWIEARLAGQDVPPDLDAQRRQRFYDHLLRCVDSAVAQDPALVH